jgi:hypothetical protein
MHFFVMAGLRPGHPSSSQQLQRKVMDPTIKPGVTSLAI